MKLLDEKVGIVTGAGGGIGRCVALALTAAGAAVVVSDIRQAAADETVALIRQAGGEAIAVVGDISEEADWVRLVAATIERFGAVDILVNNAAAASFKDRDILSMDVAVWDAAMRINLRGPMLGCKHVLAAMLQQGGGAIINIASGAALTGQLSQPAYGAAKAATISLTRSVATLYGKQGIRCNAIAPGLIMHEGLAAFFPEEHIRIDSDNLLTPHPANPRTSPTPWSSSPRRIPASSMPRCCRWTAACSPTRRAMPRPGRSAWAASAMSASRRRKASLISLHS